MASAGAVVTVVMLFAVCVRASRESACGELFGGFVCAARYSAAEFDSVRFNQVFGAVSETAADEGVDILFFEEVDDIPVSSSSGVLYR